MESRDMEVQKQESKSAPEMMEYSVKGSDTLASIALKFNTTTSKLTRMNRLSSRLLFPGQVSFEFIAHLLSHLFQNYSPRIFYTRYKNCAENFHDLRSLYF